MQNKIKKMIQKISYKIPCIFDIFEILKYLFFFFVLYANNI